MKKLLVSVLIGFAVGLLLWKVRRPSPTLEASGTTNPDRPATAREPAQRRGTALPKLVPTTPPAPPVVTNQNAPSYNAATVIVGNNMSVTSVFRSETRDPQWAGQREADITSLVERDIAAAGLPSKLSRIECRHSTCELTFTSDKPEALKQTNRLLQYALLGSVYEPGGFGQSNGVQNFTARVAFGAEQRDRGQWQAIYKDQRKQRLEMLRREGVPPGYPPLPTE